jgi:hypothetical protein
MVQLYILCSETTAQGLTLSCAGRKSRGSVLRDFLRPSCRCGDANWVTASVPGNGTRSQGLGGWERKLPAPATVPASSAAAGFRTNLLPTSPPRAAASSSEVVAPRTRAPSSAARPQPESLIEGGVASIMPMKRKDIPALLVSAPPLDPGTTPQPQLDRPAAPAAARPSQGGGNFRVEQAVQTLALPVARRSFSGQRSVPPPCGRPFQATRASPGAVTGPGFFSALARWAARRAAARTGEGSNPRFLLYTS